MRVKVKRPIEVDGKHYAAGRDHDMPDELANHWFVKGQIEHGHVVVLDEPKEVQPTPVKEDGPDKASIMDDADEADKPDTDGAQAAKQAPPQPQAKKGKK